MKQCIGTCKLNFPFEVVSHHIKKFHSSNQTKTTFNIVLTSLIGTVLNSQIQIYKFEPNYFILIL